MKNILIFVEVYYSVDILCLWKLSFVTDYSRLPGWDSQTQHPHQSTNFLSFLSFLSLQTSAQDSYCYQVLAVETFKHL